MLVIQDFSGVFISKPMIPDCIHDDNYIFYFYNRNGEVNINVRSDNWDGKILVNSDFDVISEDNNDKFSLLFDIAQNHPYKTILGKLYIKVPEPRGFKLYLNEFGWRYFEKID